MKYNLVIDFETSAFPEDQGQPIEIGAVLSDKKDFSVVSEFTSLIQFRKPFFWDVKAQEVHGISIQELEVSGHPMSFVAGDFLEWLSNFIPLGQRGQVMLGGHNLAFDLTFLRIMMRQGPLWMPNWASYHTRDTQSWAQLLNQASIEAHGFHGAVFKDTDTGYPSHRLTDVCEGLGIALTDAHSALADARATNEVMGAMVRELAGDLKNSAKYERRIQHIQKAQEQRKVRDGR